MTPLLPSGEAKAVPTVDHEIARVALIYLKFGG